MRDKLMMWMFGLVFLSIHFIFTTSNLCYIKKRVYDEIPTKTALKFVPPLIELWLSEVHVF